MPGIRELFGEYIKSYGLNKYIESGTDFIFLSAFKLNERGTSKRTPFNILSK